MEEAILTIKNVETRVARRLKLLALQDTLLLVLSGIALGSLIGAVLIRLTPGFSSALSRLSGRTIAIALVGGALLLAGVVELVHRRRRGCASGLHIAHCDSSFEIDRTLGLEDRVTSARNVLDRDQPLSAIESALVEDAARRIEGVKPADVVPYRSPSFAKSIRCFEAAGLSAVALIASLLAIAAVSIQPVVLTPADESGLAAVEAAGTRLEASSERIQSQVDPATETAKLATEQREIGRSLKEMAADPARRRDVAQVQAEALKKLNVLEYRIRERNDALKQTRADEIVGLAERSLRPALKSTPKPDAARNEKGEKGQPESAQAKQLESQDGSARKQDGSVKKDDRSESAKPGTVSKRDDRGDSAKTDTASDKRDSLGSAKKSDVSAKAEAGETKEQQGRREGNQTKPPVNGAADSRDASAGTQDTAKNPSKPDAAGSDQSNPLTDQVVGKAADLAAKNADKLAPALSEELLKKAAQLRADQLSKGDLDQIRKSAESLAKDLAKIAQSEQLRKTAEELASKITPEQIEQLAQALKGQEQLLNELKATGEMMMENRDVRQMVGGLIKDLQKEFGDKGKGNDTAGGGRGGKKANPWTSNSDDQKKQSPIARQGAPKESLKSTRDHKGEILYTNAKPGATPSKVPYTDVYPRYRREAEQSVERSRVPANMRSLVTNYFDSINPDAKKKQ